MNALLRIAVGGAIAGAAAWLIVRRRATQRRARAMQRSTSRGFTIEELINA